MATFYDKKAMKKFLYTIIICLALTACPEQEKTKEPTPTPKKDVSKAIELQKVDFAEIKNWNKDNFAQAIPAFEANCNQIAKIKSADLGISQIKISTKDYQQICKDFFAQDINSSNEFRQFIEDNFAPHLVIANGDAHGKFTAYYEAEINASYQPSKKYKYPIYSTPKDLVKVSLKDFGENLPDVDVVGRVKDGNLVPYYTRKEIEDSEFDAPILLWGDSYIDIYIMQIQGSAVAKLENGEEVRVGYQGNNGHKFLGIGSILLSQNLLKPNQANMIAIKEWLIENPELGMENMQKNDRFIFHRLVKRNGPIGAFNVVLTAGRSMAVDKTIIPLGALLWIDTTTPDKKPLQKLVAAQDIGGAIKGGVRGDYFWGSGSDEVLRLAGAMNAQGSYFIFLPKE